MTQEQKELLLKDLCARLPYGVIVEYEGNLSKLDTIFMCDSISISSTSMDKELSYNLNLDEVKPYLFPLSSMTKEQKEELFFNYIHNDIYFDDFTDYFLAGELWHDICVSINILPELINWLNKHHLDWRGLIPKGLAIDATNLNIY